MTSLEQFLEELRRAGEVDSEGRFSLDTRRTLEKLSRFQLPKPQSYVRNLVSSAVAAGASFIRVYSDADDTIFEFDGQPFGHSELKELFATLFQPQGGAVRELAVALLGARGISPSFLRIESYREEEGVKLELRGDALELRRVLRKGRPVTNRVHVRERLGARTLDKFLAKTVACTPEVQELETSCRLCPIPIDINGERLDPGVDAVIYLEPEPGRTPWFFQGQPTRPGRFAALPGYGKDLTIVVRGVSFSAPGPIAVVWADHLQKDLSELALVRNQDYRELVKWAEALG